jgi:hypothetical protein
MNVFNRVFFPLKAGRRMVLFVNDMMCAVNTFDSYGVLEEHNATTEIEGVRWWFYYDRTMSTYPEVSYQSLMADHEFTGAELYLVKLDSSL